MLQVFGTDMTQWHTLNLGLDKTQSGLEPEDFLA